MEKASVKSEREKKHIQELVEMIVEELVEDGKTVLKG
jgi:hypothetical protein